MLKEVIVVEGKSDIQRIHQAIDADCARALLNRFA